MTVSWLIGLHSVDGVRGIGRDRPWNRALMRGWLHSSQGGLLGDASLLLIPWSSCIERVGLLALLSICASCSAHTRLLDVLAQVLRDVS